MFIRYLDRMDSNSIDTINQRLWNLIGRTTVIHFDFPGIHNHRSVKFYLEIFIINMLVKFPRYIKPHLLPFELLKKILTYVAY